MKKFHFTAFLSLALTLAAAALYGSESSPTRDKIDLDGVWSFATDPDNVGESQSWQSANAALPVEQLEGYAPAVPGKIEVPGIWDAQGYGLPTDKVKHNFVGKGWYQRKVSVPRSWDESNSAILVLEGISRSAKVWVDGNQVGDEAVGCIGSHYFDVTPYIKAGQTATLTICVNSAQNWAVDPLLGAASLNDYLEIKWGGLWGHVYIEARPKTRLDGIYLRTKLEYDAESNVTSARAIAEAEIFSETASKFTGSVRFELFDKQDNIVATAVKSYQDLALTDGKAAVALSARVPGAKLWSPDSPYLYRAKVQLFPTDAPTDAIESTYGMRDIKFVGSRIYLNGKPFFLRGYGDDHIYPREFSMSTDIEMYRERLKAIKEYGFNHCRHHSCILPHEYYDACDELGMFPNGEMLLGYPQQLPGEGGLWKANVPAGQDPKPALDTLKERWAAVVKEYRNHPSIFIWVGGNELVMLGVERWNAMTLGPEFYAIAKSLDPDRYFMDCDGDWLHEYKARGGRKAEDCYSILFDEWSNPVLNADKFKPGVKFDKPTVSHEAGNFLTFSREDQVELFEGCNYKPFWMVDGKNALEKLGLAGEVEDWARASEQLYLLSHKYNVEGVRRNDDLSGYHWWLIQDYWTTSNGIFDLFFRPKSLKPSDILPFNNDLVVVQEGFEFSYVSGNNVSVTPMISNFAPASKTGELVWTLTTTDASIASLSGKAAVADAPNGKLTTLEPIAFAVPETNKPLQATLTLTFNAADETTYSNTWTTTIFPKTIAPTVAKQLYADDTAIEYFPSDWGVKLLSELDGAEYPSDAVYAVAWATPRVIDAVERGAGCIHFGASQFLSSLPLRFQQTWWKAGDSEESNNTGTYVYPNPITDGVVNANFCGASWAALLDGAVKYNLAVGEDRPEVFVRALTSIVRVRDAAVMFELGCGQGKLVISGLNHEKTLAFASMTPEAAPDAAKAPADGLSPLSRWLMARMLDRAGNGVPAKTAWERERIVPPVKVPEGTILGVERVMQNAEVGTWNSYREMNQSSSYWLCRQNKLGNDLVWRTAPAALAAPAEGEAPATTTFIFAGGLGFAASAKSGGFELTFNDALTLKFDVVENFDGATKEFVWTSEDGAMTLKLDARAELAPNDKYGLFYLTVPTSAVVPSKPQQIRVKSLGENSSRWFGLNLFTDLAE